MFVKSLANDGRRSVRTHFRWRSVLCDGCEALDKADVAELSVTVINNMACDELVRMIRVAGLPDQLCPNLDKRLPFYDHTALTRLAHLAQRCCRNHRHGPLEKDAE